MEAEGNRFSTIGAQAPMRAEDKKFRIKEAIRIRTYASASTQAKKIPGWLREQHLRREWQELGRSMGVRGDAEETRVCRLQHRRERDGCDVKILSSSMQRGTPVWSACSQRCYNACVPNEQVQDAERCRRGLRQRRIYLMPAVLVT
jgi:hypothetical protein